MNLPNQITTARFLISLVLFVVLSFIPSQDITSSTQQNLESSSFLSTLNDSILLDIGLALFLIGAISDYFDGYFARKYNMISTFGRIADPFVDKILVGGTFIFFIRITSLVSPWMVVIIIGREMLISALRSFMESQKIPFGANSSGKFKMFLQCITIVVLFLYLGHFKSIPYFDWVLWGLLWFTVIITLTSMIGYIRASYKIMKNS